MNKDPYAEYRKSVRDRIKKNGVFLNKETEGDDSDLSPLVYDWSIYGINYGVFPDLDSEIRSQDVPEPIEDTKGELEYTPKENIVCSCGATVSVDGMCEECWGNRQRASIKRSNAYERASIPTDVFKKRKIKPYKKKNTHWSILCELENNQQG